MTALLVHEWITKRGGSENVFAEMASAFPTAELLCMWNDDPERFPPSRTRETWLARTPLRRNRALALPLMPLAWRYGLQGTYDWMLVSSHAFAHHARVRGVPGDRRFVYVHSPARYIWNPETDARGSSLLARAGAAALKPLDADRARESSNFAANSAFVQERVRKHWGVESKIIYPPVAVEEIQSVNDWRTTLSAAELRVLEGLPADYLLGASRFVSYKRLDLVIKAGNVLGLPVVLAGAGPEEVRLRKLAEHARVPVIIVKSPSTSLLRAMFQQSCCYIFPALEDFGIMPVEAMAAGAAVVAIAAGGSLETIRPGINGAFADFSSEGSIRAAVTLATGTSREKRKASAGQFSTTSFRRQLVDWLKERGIPADEAVSAPCGG